MDARGFARLLSRRVYVADLHRFPGMVQRAVRGIAEGLALTFTAPLNRIDHFIIDGVIVGVLGRDTACEIAEFVVREGETYVRLTADSPDQLLAVALVLTDVVGDVDSEDQQREVEVWGKRYVAEDLKSRWKTTAETLASVELRVEPKNLEALVAKNPGYGVFKGFSAFKPSTWRQQAGEMILPVWSALMTAAKDGAPY